jgi:repressor of nif and glnA expression
LNSAKDNPENFSKLMSSMDELKSLVKTLNSASTQISDDGTYDRILKVGEIYNNAVSSYVKSTFNISGVNLSNIHEIYNPLKSGKFDDLLNVRDHFVKQGMMIEEATRIAEQYR